MSRLQPSDPLGLLLCQQPHSSSYVPAPRVRETLLFAVVAFYPSPSDNDNLPLSDGAPALPGLATATAAKAHKPPGLLPHYLVGLPLPGGTLLCHQSCKKEAKRTVEP